MHRLFGLIAVSILLLSLPRAQGGGVVDDGTMHFNFEDGLIWVDVAVVGCDRPLHFVLDSGAGVTVIDTQAARNLGLAGGQAITVQGLRGPAIANRLKGFNASVAGQTLPATPLALDLEPVSRLCHRRIDGLIGADFLLKHKLQINYPLRILRFGASCREPGEQAVKIKLKRRNDVCCAAVRVSGNRRQWVRIDTGHDGALAWYPGRRNALRPDSRTTLALERARPGAASLAVEMGRLQVKVLRTSVLSEPPFPGEAGLLGNAFFRDYVVTLDFGRSRLILDRPE